LNPLELEVEDLRDRAHEQRFGETRRARDQTVSSREQADQQLLDHVGLPDDHFRKLGLHTLPSPTQMFDHLLFLKIFFGVRCHRAHSSRCTKRGQTPWIKCRLKIKLQLEGGQIPFCAMLF
jgi:hypothetical protein